MLAPALWRILVLPALAAAYLLSSGTAWTLGPPAAQPPKQTETKPSAGKPAEQKPVEATKPSKSAMKRGDILRSPADPVVGVASRGT